MFTEKLNRIKQLVEAADLFNLNEGSESSAKNNRIQPFLDKCLQVTRTRSLYYRAVLHEYGHEWDISQTKLDPYSLALSKIIIQHLKPKEYIPLVRNWFIMENHKEKLDQLIKELGDVEGLIDDPKLTELKKCDSCGKLRYMFETETECRKCTYEYNKKYEEPEFYDGNKKKTNTINNLHDNSQKYRYSKHKGYNGWDDDTIDSAFEGNSEATWNID